MSTSYLVGKVQGARSPHHCAAFTHLQAVLAPCKGMPWADPLAVMQALTGGLRAAALCARPPQLISCRSFAGAGPAPKAAALIIGNEILSGSITDTNTPWLAKLLYRSAPTASRPWTACCTPLHGASSIMTGLATGCMHVAGA